jgi:hypothetical protein
MSNLVSFFLNYVFSSFTFKMLSQRSPIPTSPIPYPPTAPFWPWCSPVLGHIRFASPMGLSLQWWPTRPSFDTYAAKDKSSWVLVSSYCCSTYRVAVPFSSSIGGRVTHPIADCDHPLLCLLGPGIVSQERAISGRLISWSFWTPPGIEGMPSRHVTQIDFQIFFLLLFVYPLYTALSHLPHPLRISHFQHWACNICEFNL